MKPILFATARSGSTIIGELIGDLAVQLWGSKGFIREFFGVSQNLVTEAKIVNGKLYLQRNQYVDQPWCLDVQKEKLHRKAMVDADPHYVIKFLIGQVEDWTIPWLSEFGYTPIFIERQDKVKQLLSFLSAKQTGNWYYHKSRNNSPVKEIKYNEEQAIDLIWQLRNFKEFKKKFDNPITIYYEDFMHRGGNQKAVIEILGLQINHNEPESDSALTPYSKKPEDIIEQDINWLNAKERIIKLLNDI